MISHQLVASKILRKWKIISLIITSNIKFMKNILLIICLFCLNSVAFSESPLSISNSSKSEIVAPLPLPDGVYVLCCQNGYLNLYNLAGELVGSGTDCGGLTTCIKAIINSNSNKLMINPTKPSSENVLSLINSLKRVKGENYSGSFEEMPTYYFLSTDIKF